MLEKNSQSQKLLLSKNTNSKMQAI